MLPIIYTPVVGEACQQFSFIYRQPHGLFIPYSKKENIDKILDNIDIPEVEVIVVTDGQRILGLGDQGAGGMGIPIGKLSLYSSCGGIDPKHTLPVLLDVGTDNEDLQKDPDYIGWRHHRITGKVYDDFLEAFVQGVKRKFPNVLLQFEDFAQQHAGPLLQRYRHQLCCFNDDIQGTAAVTLGALLAAMKATESKLTDQRVVVVGGGSAGCGISEQCVFAMMQQRLSEKDARDKFYVVDRYGLIHDKLANLLPFQQKLMQPYEKVKQWGTGSNGEINLLDVIKHVQPTILIGVSGQYGLFTEEVIREMADHCSRPIIFPLSNPISRAEAVPEDVMQWTNGHALIATGSPFGDVYYQGKKYSISQCNNSYIFPGVGLGVLAVKAKRVTDEMFMAAAIALSACIPAEKQKQGLLLPDLKNIHEVSKKIAFAVASKAQEQGYAEKTSSEALQEIIKNKFWRPEYLTIKYAD